MAIDLADGVHTGINNKDSMEQMEKGNIPPPPTLVPI